MSPMRFAACVLLFSSLQAWSSEVIARNDSWEVQIAALTDDRPSVYGPAIESLIRLGAPVLGDVTQLASDADWRVRGRVVTVATGIPGPEAVKILLSATRDSEPRVRALAALGLGKSPSEGVYERLRDLLSDISTEVRIAAGRGLSNLSDPRGLADLANYAQERDDKVKASLKQSLVDLATLPGSVMPLSDLIATARGDDLYALLEASGSVGDPRLSPALAAVVGVADLRAAILSARSLSANGDSRALEALCKAASDNHSELSSTATATLRLLTGYSAAPGNAWQLWWRDHGADAQKLSARDAFVAGLHDPAQPVSRADLAKFSTEDLMPLIDGSLGSGPPWWHTRAWAIVQLDEPQRWTQALVARIEGSADPAVRLALIITLDQLDDPAAKADFQRMLDKVQVEDARQRKSGGERNNPERLALQVAIERRQAERGRQETRRWK
jgi:HEAT repeat protein